MEKLIIEIAKSQDHYGAYAVNCTGVYGAGNTVEEAKENVLEGLRLLIESRKSDELPDILKGEYKVLYKYDAQSFLKYFEDIFSKPALEKITGINQKQLHHYASGIRKPRVAQRKKIEYALHNLGKELLSFEL
jgi:predicted RNase H-like HicB family nuclease